MAAVKSALQLPKSTTKYAAFAKSNKTTFYAAIYTAIYAAIYKAIYTAIYTAIHTAIHTAFCCTVQPTF